MLARRSSDHAAMFGPDINLAWLFNDLVAPNAGGFTLGDYSGLTAAVTDFLSVFVKTTAATPPAQPTELTSSRRASKRTPVGPPLRGGAGRRAYRRPPEKVHVSGAWCVESLDGGRLPMRGSRRRATDC